MPDDEFAADGSEQLVRVSGGASSATYRARFERSFVRYTWCEIGSGAGGYWVAEYPDGRVGYFGATQYDGYGQLVRSDDFGVVHTGPPEMPGACAPCEDRPSDAFGGACGEECTGDEMSEERSLIEPGAATGGRWILGRIVRVLDPSTGETRFELDAAGNVVARTDARGVTTRTEYDGANRPIARYDAASPEATRITFRYDVPASCEPARCANAAGRLVEARSPLPDELAGIVGGAFGEDHAGYDARGQAVYAARVLGEVRLAMTERFDNAGRHVETAFPDGQRVVRRFEGASRLSAIDGLIERVEYDARGAVARVVRADGSEDVLEHDALMRLARLTSTTADGRMFQAYAYERDTDTGRFSRSLTARCCRRASLRRARASRTTRGTACSARSSRRARSARRRSRSPTTRSTTSTTRRVGAPSGSAIGSGSTRRC